MNNLNGEEFLLWKERSIILDLGLSNTELERFYIQYKNGNIKYIKEVLIRDVLNVNNINLINLSNNAEYSDLFRECRDFISLVDLAETKIYYKGSKLHNIDYHALENQLLLDYTTKILQSDIKSKQSELDSSYYLLKSRYFKKLQLDELLTLYTKAVVVNKVYNITTIKDNLYARLVKLIDIRQLIDTNTIKVLSVDRLSAIDSIHQLEQYLDTVTNTQVEMLIKFMKCK